MRPFLVAVACSAAVALVSSRAAAFCGFYVSGADAKLFADATQVVLMREGTRTVLSMQNDYKGPPEAFAMVIPVPVVLSKENVKTLPRDVFTKVDELGAPRLVEYWEQDPCRKDEGGDLAGLGAIGGLGLSGIGFGGGGAGIELGVKVEAQFSVAEYEVVVLSAKDSGGLDTWLRQEKYAIPQGSEPYFRPYVQSGSKFFVAKVDPKKVTFQGGRATLSPLRFHYDADSFTLPIRLGLVNSGGVQDLIVNVLAKRTRYEVANYPNVMIPTNLDVAETARDKFGEFYAALFDATLAKTKNAVVTEYAWDAGTCDPCPGPTLDAEDLLTLGADVIPGGTDGLARSSLRRVPRGPAPSIRLGTVSVGRGLPAAVVSRIVRQRFGQVRACYEEGLRSNPTLGGTVQLRFTITKTGEPEALALEETGTDLRDARVRTCIADRLRKGLTFPEPEGGATVPVTLPFTLAPPGADAGAGQAAPMRPIGSTGPTPYVLTRLHVRYAKDAIGEDLVFRAAPPVVGGREVRGDGAELEKGARPDATNNFQARYAIRHAWAGPIACAAPRRGLWGGPPPGDAGAELGAVSSPAPLAASKTAFAPRGNLTLASMLKASDASSIGEPSAASPATSRADAGLRDAADPSGSPPVRGCGACAASSVPAGGGGASTASLVAALAVLVRGRRRRRGHPATKPPSTATFTSPRCRARP